MEGVFLMFSGGILFALGAVFTNILAQAIGDANVFPLFFWELLFGIFWFEYYHFWVFIGFWGMAIFNLFSLVFVQSALQKGKAVLMVPIQNTLVFIVPVIAGLFVFQQSFNNYFLFSIAFVLIIFSVCSLSKFQAKLEMIDK